MHHLLPTHIVFHLLPCVILIQSLRQKQHSRLPKIRKSPFSWISHKTVRGSRSVNRSVHKSFIIIFLNRLLTRIPSMPQNKIKAQYLWYIDPSGSRSRKRSVHENRKNQQQPDPVHPHRWRPGPQAAPFKRARIRNGESESTIPRYDGTGCCSVRFWRRKLPAHDRGDPAGIGQHRSDRHQGR